MIASHPAPATVTPTDPNGFIDFIKDHLQIETDADLAIRLSVAPPVISKIRGSTLNVGPTLLLRLHEESGIEIKDLKKHLTKPTATNARARAWTRLPSGAHLDLNNPDPHVWTDEDLAIRLARTYRWSGESRWDTPLSVAQHSLTVLAIRKQRSTKRLTQIEMLQELLHDAEEGFLGFDCISPLKPILSAPFKRVSTRLFEAIRTRYALPDWTPESHKLHKTADTIAAASEAVHCAGWSIDEVKNVLEINYDPLEHDPLVSWFQCEPWEPWPSNVAATRFLETLRSLQS